MPPLPVHTCWPHSTFSKHLHQWPLDHWSVLTTPVDIHVSMVTDNLFLDKVSNLSHLQYLQLHSFFIKWTKQCADSVMLLMQILGKKEILNVIKNVFLRPPSNLTAVYLIIYLHIHRNGFQCQMADNYTFHILGQWKSLSLQKTLNIYFKNIQKLALNCIEYCH